MAKDRERTVNPAAAQRKAEKLKALKKGKAAVQAQRNERLAHRNPDRLERQIDDLKSLQARTGSLSARDKRTLEELERDVNRVRKAKEALGTKAETSKKADGYQNFRTVERREAHSSNDLGGAGEVLGKRRRLPYESHDAEASSETDESLRQIPMPQDTPPPTPPRWHWRAGRQRSGRVGATNDANTTPLGEARGAAREPHALSPRPEVKAQAQTVYESKAQVIDLRRNAVERFVPAVVQRKLGSKKLDGSAGLVDGVEKEVHDSSTAIGIEGTFGSGRQAGSASRTSKATELGAEEERFERVEALAHGRN